MDGNPRFHHLWLAGALGGGPLLARPAGALRRATGWSVPGTQLGLRPLDLDDVAAAPRPAAP